MVCEVIPPPSCLNKTSVLLCSISKYANEPAIPITNLGNKVVVKEKSRLSEADFKEVKAHSRVAKEDRGCKPLEDDQLHKMFEDELKMQRQPEAIITNEDKQQTMTEGFLPLSICSGW